jgi:hypothetical protein
MDPRIKQIRVVLDELARADRLDNDAKEVVYDRELAKVRWVDRSNIVEVVRNAVGSDAKRRRFAPFIFSELYDVPGIDTVFRELLETSDPTGRADIIQTIGLRRMRGLAGVLNEHFTREADDFCRYCLLHSLAKIADDSSLPIFEHLMKKGEKRDEWSLVVAAKEYGRPEFKRYLLRVFEDPGTKTTHRLIASWGLAKLGDKAASDYLACMLDDPVSRTALRAAQAISDINGWDFEWHADSVALVKRRRSETA